MEIKLYRPTDPLLRTYIECFYTLKCPAGDAPVRYAAFPSNYSMVCLNTRSQVEVSGHNLAFSQDFDKPLISSLICEFDSPGWITYTGHIDEIVIYFKPLAINAFLDNPLGSYIQSFFAPFFPHADHAAAMVEMFGADGDATRIGMLERYWRSKFNGFEHPFLPKILNDLVSDDFRGSLADLAKRHRISRTTLVKHFDRYLGTTPSQFRKIARFRQAMKCHRTRVDDQNLTAISCEADYFDQSHMIKDFRSLTSLPPRTFFSKISTLEDGQINWLFA